MLDEFIEWEKMVKPDINHVIGILSNRISDEPAELISDLQNIEAWNARIGCLMAEADSFLDRYRLIALPKREGRTEADRKAEQDSEVAKIKVVRDTLEHLSDSIKQRLILGESCLSYFKQMYAERKPIQTQRMY